MSLLSTALSSLALLGALALAPTARADQDEASIHVELDGGVARVGEERTDAHDTVPVAGIAARFGYGVRDWLSFDAELGIAQLGTAHFDSAQVTFGGVPGATGPIERSARVARAIAGATLRLGVRFVPTLTLGIGPQVRLRAAAIYLPTGNIPDDHTATIDVDVIATARVGLDWRANRRWLAGIWAGGSVAVPIGGPSYQAAEAGLRLEYNWYPLW